ncbi:HNH endonuclease signature motif containing protein [Microbacterium luticocti]|uniref:HNH endonuclease signature motif containing protein n=1 Tax=Microbacterium luticocti TaxID=451764 RepID=UPI000685FFF4|nr:HNH endonuclease signature motif containing protein [Microbacterium luticocti]
MAESMHAGDPSVFSELDELVDDLSQSRAQAARAFAAEMFFFERVTGLVQRRERERAARDGKGAITRSSQLGMREVFAEIGAALRLSEWQVARKVSLAWTLMHHFEETLYDASDGRVTPEQATVIAETGTVIADEAVRREYEAVALDMATEMTHSQLKAALMGLVSRLDPEGTQRRVREAVQRRRVTLRELEPGLSRLTADLPTAQAVGIMNRIRAIAIEVFDQNASERAEGDAADRAEASDGSAEASEGRTAGRTEASDRDAPDRAEATVMSGSAGAEGRDGAGGVRDGAQRSPDDAGDEQPALDERTAAQIMADVFCDVLLTGSVHGHGGTAAERTALSSIRATVQVTVPATTLAGETTGGGEVIGFGPIDDETARHLASTAPAWTRVFTDPCRGVPHVVDRYRPTKRQRLLLQARDEHCRFPGCRRPALKCDVDHTVPYSAGGPTCLCNLEHLCKRHHTVKHETAWRVEQLPGGVLRWSAPTGRVHLTHPPGFFSARPPGPTAGHPPGTSPTSPPGGVRFRPVPETVAGRGPDDVCDAPF